MPKYRHCLPSSTVLLRTTRPEVLAPLLFCPCLCRCCLRRCCLCPVAAVAAVALPPPSPSPPQLPLLSSSSSVAFHCRLLPLPSHVVDCCLFVSNPSSYPAPSSLLPPPARLADVVNCRTNSCLLVDCCLSLLFPAAATAAVTVATAAAPVSVAISRLLRLCHHQSCLHPQVGRLQRRRVTGHHGHVHRWAAGCWSRWEVSILDDFLLNR
jgi:hypothetical protein